MMVPVLTLVPACGVNIQMQCNESEIKIMYLSWYWGNYTTEHMKIKTGIYNGTSIMVLPICSSCCPVGQCPSMRRLGALPIVILERFLRLDCVITRKNLSRQGASATTMSPKEDKPSCRHRRVWLTRWRRTSVWLAMMVRTSRTGLLSSKNARSAPRDGERWRCAEGRRCWGTSRRRCAGGWARCSWRAWSGAGQTKPVKIIRPRSVDKGEFLDALVRRLAAASHRPFPWSGPSSSR